MPKPAVLDICTGAVRYVALLSFRRYLQWRFCDYMGLGRPAENALRGGCKSLHSTPTTQKSGLRDFVHRTLWASTASRRRFGDAARHSGPKVGNGLFHGCKSFGFCQSKWHLNSEYWLDPLLGGHLSERCRSSLEPDLLFWILRTGCR